MEDEVDADLGFLSRVFVRGLLLFLRNSFIQCVLKLLIRFVVNPHEVSGLKSELLQFVFLDRMTLCCKCPEMTSYVQ